MTGYVIVDKNREVTDMTAPTGVYDIDHRVIFFRDMVSLLGMVGEVTFECGAYGIAFQNPIDWDVIESRIPEVTGCNNYPRFCYNDNFISFWELIWNFNCEDNVCIVVKKVD